MPAHKDKSGEGWAREAKVRYRTARRLTARDVLAALEGDAETRVRIAGLLGVPAGLPEALNRLADEIRAQREAFEARFAESDRRFEAMNHRFEVMEHRFEEMDRRFEAMDRRFEAMDRRFEAMRVDMDRRFAEVIARLDDTNQRLGDLRSWVESNVGGLQRRAGRRLEDTIAGTLRFAMDVRDIRPDQLRLRQKMRDERGMIGPPGREYEYDLLAADGEAIVFEIKSVAEVEDIERFSDKARLVAESLGRPGLRRVLVTLDKPPEIVDACRRLDITLV